MAETLEQKKKREEQEKIAAQNKKDAAMMNDPNARRATLGKAAPEKPKTEQPAKPKQKGFWRGLMRMMGRNG